MTAAQQLHSMVRHSMPQMSTVLSHLAFVITQTQASIVSSICAGNMMLYESMYTSDCMLNCLCEPLECRFVAREHTEWCSRRGVCDVHL